MSKQSESLLQHPYKTPDNNTGFFKIKFSVDAVKCLSFLNKVFRIILIY